MTNDRQLDDRVAVVTGGSTGIGLATARRLLSVGASVMVASTDSSRGRRVVANLATDRAAFHRADVTDETSVVSLIDATIQRFGHLDFLFNNAGVEGTVGPMAAWSADVVDAVLDVNVKGPFLCMKHAAPQMAAGSVIVNCSSLLATIPMPAASPYAASKAAVLSLTRSVAAELGTHGICVLAVCPGVVDTPMMDRVSLAAGAPKTALAAMVCPSQQVTSPERVADAVTALLADPSAFPSGSSVWIGPRTFELVSVPSVSGTSATSAASSS
jgi:NAD(P)-dependent dehydrogenase (short-subunit alcohol dehydrogenase family)